MRIVAAREDVVRSGELDGKPERVHVEVDRVEVEVAQICARRAIDVAPAVLEREKAAIQPLGEIGNRAAEVAERPADSRKPLEDSGKDQRRGGERGVEQEADE